jgi:hypothetical protein
LASGKPMRAAVSRGSAGSIGMARDESTSTLRILGILGFRAYGIIGIIRPVLGFWADGIIKVFRNIRAIGPN